MLIMGNILRKTAVREVPSGVKTVRGRRLGYREVDTSGS